MTVLPPMAYRTWSIRSPLATHTRRATCTEVGCLAQENGWRTVVDERTELGQRQAYYIRVLVVRRFVETRLEDGTTAFTFPPGQTCFDQHRVSLERPEFFLVRPGDSRVPARRSDYYRHRHAEDWLDDLFPDYQRLIENRG